MTRDEKVRILFSHNPNEMKICELCSLFEYCENVNINGCNKVNIETV